MNNLEMKTIPFTIAPKFRNIFNKRSTRLVHSKVENIIERK